MRQSFCSAGREDDRRVDFSPHYGPAHGHRGQVVGKGRRVRSGSRLRRALAGWLLLAAWAAALPGCSLGVMAGKMLFGDPLTPCAFTGQTGVDLAKEGKRVIVLCSTPDAVRSDFPSLEVDLLDGVARQLKRRDIAIVSPDEVASWLDDHGGRWDDPSEMAEHFHADYVVHIDLDRFTYKEENSPDLFRGRALGNVIAYQAVRNADGTRARRIFEREFTSEYPTHHPVSVTTVSARNFRKQYLDRVTGEIAHMFYNHRFSEEIY